MNTFNTLRLVMGIRGFLSLVLGLFADADAKPPRPEEPAKATVTRVENGAVVIESRQRLADGSEITSREVISIFVK